MPFSCFLFRPRKSCKKRRKRSHTNVSDASVIRTSTPSAQPPHVRFHRRKRVHTRLCSKNRTQRLTRRNKGVSDGGGITTLGLFHTFRKPCVARGQNGVLCRFWVLAGCTQKNAESLGTAMRLCESLSRGVAAPLGCVIFSVSVEIAACMPCAQGLSVCARRGVVSLPSARFTCC